MSTSSLPSYSSTQPPAYPKAKPTRTMAGEGSTPSGELIRAAIDKQDPQHFSSFLNDNPSITNAGRVAPNTTTLEYACQRPNSAIILLLLDAGADPALKKPGFYASPLSYVVAAGHPMEVIEKLLARGARAQDSVALDEAIKCNRADVLKLLFSRGADPGVGGHDGKTFLQLAREQGCDQSVIGELEDAEKEKRAKRPPLWKRIVNMDVYFAGA